MSDKKGRRPALKALSASERRLLGLVHRAGTTTQADITRSMKIGQPAVSRLVAGLAAGDMLRVGQAQPRGRGKPSASLTLNGAFAYGLGVSILGDSVSVSLIDFAGAPLWSAATPMGDMRRPAVLAELKRLQARMLAESGVDPDRILAAGAGVSAFFVGEGALMNPPSLLDDWALMDIAPILSEALGLPTRVDNDGNVACIGESLLGVGRRFRSFAYFQITNGFGGGVIIDGAPHRGVFGNAGEFAALWQAMGIVHPNLEHMRQIHADHGVVFDTVSDMLRGLDVDHPAVEAWLEEAGPAFSLAATAAYAVADCEAVVLGGRLPRPLAFKLADRIKIVVTDRRGRPPPLPRIIPAETRGDAVSLGAAVLALQPTFFL